MLFIKPRKIPISIKISVAIILIALIQLGVSYWNSSTQLKEKAISDTIEKTQATLVTFQETLQFLFFNREFPQIQKTIASLGAYPDIKQAFLLDENNKVLASTRIEFIKQPLANIFNENKHIEFNNHLNQSKEKLKNILWKSDDGISIFAISPVILGRSSSAALRSDRVGTLYIHKDLKLTEFQTQQLLQQYAITDLLILTLTGLLLVLFFNFNISKRLKLANNAAKEFSNNNYATRINITGNDEISDLGRTFNSMAKKVKGQRIELLSREKNLAETLQQRNTALKKLEDSQDRTHLLLNSMAEAVYGVDKSGHCSFINQACIRMLGYSQADEVIGQDMHQLIHHNHANGQLYARADSPIYQSYTSGKKTHIENEVFWRKDGTSFVVEYWAHPIFEGDTCIGSVVTFLDITKRKQNEEIVQRTQKMDALGKLTGGIAHDFNNMLGVILGYAELLEESLQDEPSKEKLVKEISHAGQRGAQLTKKLLSFSKHTTSVTKAADINKTLQQQQDLLEKTLTVRIKLILILTDSLWTVNIDSNEFEDAVINISINAMHAIDGYGSLTINTRNITLNSQTASNLELVKGDYVVVIFTDTGRGFDAGVKEKIFDPFFTTKGDDGTGLGLTQVYGFMQRCKGSVYVESSPNQGTSITLYFPRHTDNNNDEHDSESYHIETSKGKATILVVDDEIALLKLTVTILSANGYHVLSANSAKQALDILEKEHVDLVFSDIVMPNMDGYQLADIIGEKYPDIKIQLASGYNDSLHNSTQQPKLHENLLSKPYNSKELLEKIHLLLNA